MFTATATSVGIIGPVMDDFGTCYCKTLRPAQRWPERVVRGRLGCLAGTWQERRVAGDLLLRRPTREIHLPVAYGKNVQGTLTEEQKRVIRSLIKVLED